MAGVLVVAPSAAIAFDKLAKMHKKKSSRAYADYLKRSGYFDATQHDDAFVIKLSSTGKNRFSNKPLETFTMPDTQEWDGKWHILMFDIPETHKSVRQYIAQTLRGLGLRLVQDSVYVHYASTEDLAACIREQFPEVAKLIVSAELTRIDGEQQLKKAFSLGQSK